MESTSRRHYAVGMAKFPRSCAALLLSIFFVVVSAGAVTAHPGGTNELGCHKCWTNCLYWGEFEGAIHCHATDIDSGGSATISDGDPVYGWRVRSPSGNIQCVYANDTIACTSKALGKTAFLTRGGRAWVKRGVLTAGGGATLPYGANWSPDYQNSGLGCASRRDGFYCFSDNDRFIYVSKSLVRTGWI
jgi:hypothetical protein